MLCMLLMLGGSAYALYQAGGEFLPELRESHLIVHMNAVAGTSLKQTLTTGKAVTARLREIEAVRGVCHLAGRVS